MARKPLTPSEIALKTERERITITLNKQNLDKLREYVVNTNPPITLVNLIDEAIESYIESLKDQNSNNSKK